jgi:hypothetical protein
MPPNDDRKYLEAEERKPGEYTNRVNAMRAGNGERWNEYINDVLFRLVLNLGRGLGEKNAHFDDVEPFLEGEGEGKPGYRKRLGGDGSNPGYLDSHSHRLNEFARNRLFGRARLMGSVAAMLAGSNPYVTRGHLNAGHQLSKNTPDPENTGDPIPEPEDCCT